MTARNTFRPGGTQPSVPLIKASSDFSGIWILNKMLLQHHPICVFIGGRMCVCYIFGLVSFSGRNTASAICFPHIITPPTHTHTLHTFSLNSSLSSYQQVKIFLLSPDICKAIIAEQKHLVMWQLIMYLLTLKPFIYSLNKWITKHPLICSIFWILKRMLFPI